MENCVGETSPLMLATLQRIEGKLDQALTQATEARVRAEEAQRTMDRHLDEHGTGKDGALQWSWWVSTPAMIGYNNRGKLVLIGLLVLVSAVPAWWPYLPHAVSIFGGS